MKGQPDGFWAKFKRGEDGSIEQWHSVEAHCADVAAVAEALLQRSILKKRLAHLLGIDDLDRPRIQRLAALVAIHDAGKVNHGFQNRGFDRPGPRAGHVGPILNLLFRVSGKDQKAVADALGLSDFVRWFASLNGFASTLSSTLSHHGRPVAAESRRESELWRPNDYRDPLEGLAKLRGAVDRWFPDAFVDNVAAFEASPQFQHAFNGLVTLADWLGSDEEIFQYAPDDADRMPWARKRAAVALEQLGLDPSSARTSLGSEEPNFAAISEYTPYDVQQKCLDLPLYPQGSLTLLESDTGSGKTEAVLARFMRMFHAGLVDGMYFALPTRTAATQLHERVEAAVKLAFPKADRPPVLLAVPGYLRVDRKEGQRVQHGDATLPSFEVLWPDDDTERWKYRGWAAEQPKRYLAGVVGVGTVDQVLMSALQVNHAQLRATSLSRHLLVVDEVHASDAYMTRLLREVLDRHLEAGGHALLMSATLGTRAASRYFRQEAPSVEAAEQRDYPLLMHAPADRSTVEIISAEAADYSKEVEVGTTPLAHDPVAVARRALEAAESGARVLIIRNLVQDCVQTQAALERLSGPDNRHLFCVAGAPAPHHSRFAAADRRKLDEQIEDDFGKDSQRSGVIAVATQTVEQSLDLDADLMLTDLCPIDVLLQRIGRLHRHADRTRPKGYDTAKVDVLVPESRDLAEEVTTEGFAPGPHGLGTVYSDLRVLEATWRQIDEYEQWVIPTMNRTLVEAATHLEHLEKIVEELGGVWPDHQEYIRGAEFGDRTKAGIALIQRDKPFERASYAKENMDSRLKTRLGLEDRRVGFEEPFEGPFGELIYELSIADHMWKGADDDAEFAEDVRVDGDVCRFRFGALNYTYGRHGLDIERS